MVTGGAELLVLVLVLALGRRVARDPLSPWGGSVGWAVVEGGEERRGHTMTFMEHLDAFVVLGGWSTKHGYIDSIGLFSVRDQMWMPEPKQEHTPKAREGHTAVAVGHDIFVFGGFNKGEFYGDLHVLDTDTWTWRQPITSGNPPSARRDHTSAQLHDGSIVIYGGYSPYGTLDDVIVLNTQMMAWSYIDTEPTTLNKARAGHTMHRIGRMLLIIGGRSDETAFQDLLTLDLDTLQWSTVTAKGRGISPVYQHTSTAYDSNVFVLGGCDETNAICLTRAFRLSFESDFLEWKVYQRLAPYSIIMDSTASAINGTLYWFGGCNLGNDCESGMRYLKRQDKAALLEVDTPQEPGVFVRYFGFSWWFSLCSVLLCFYFVLYHKARGSSSAPKVKDNLIHSY